MHTKTKDLGEFEEFYQAFPNRKGKFAAEKAYAKARQRATQQELMDGILRYVAMKPAWQAFAHPSTWLNAGRWLDEGTLEPTQPFTAAELSDARRVRQNWLGRCPHVPSCDNAKACEGEIIRRWRRERGEAP